MNVAASTGITAGWHPVWGELKYNAHEMAGTPDAQVEQTVGLMWGRVWQDSHDPEFVDWTRRVVGDSGSPVERAQRIWQHTKANIQFQRDPGFAAATQGPGIGEDDIVEMIVRPVDMMRYVKRGNAAGDCDDFVMYQAAMLTCQGIECCFATVAANGNDPAQYSHVYVVAYPVVDDGGTRLRVPMDASHGQWCGWEVPNQWGKFREWARGDVERKSCVTGAVIVAAAIWLAVSISK